MIAIGGSMSSKELFCYFHVGGTFVVNDEGQFEYGGGSVRLRSIKEGITVEDLREMISLWFGIDGNSCEMKYRVSFDEKTLVDLVDDSEIRNFFQYNERYDHLYVASKGKESGANITKDPKMVDRFFRLSQQSCCSFNSVETVYELVGYQNMVGALMYEFGGGCSNITCGVQSAPTPYPEMNSSKWTKLILGCLQNFTNAKAFKKSVYKYSIAHNFEFKYVKNTKDKISVRCNIKGCPWKICANAVGKKTPFLRVTTFVNEHVHSAQDNLQVTHGGRSSLTSSIIIDEVRNHIDKRPSEIMTTLKRDNGVNLTYKQAYRAKEKAMEEIHSRPEQSYMLIPWICQRLKETDDKTVAKWVAIGNSIFERVFIAYGCCIEGFLSGARHILYIDETHLSGLYKGTLLSASAYDADNELLPFTIAIVKRETYEDWSWFLHMIKNIVSSIELTIVSDRHNSIIVAIRAIFGSERHAYCYRHVKENFSTELLKSNRGKRKTSKSMKEDGLQLLDNIAYARLDGEFDKAMDHMRCFSPQLFEWLKNNGDVEKWALSKFPYRRWDNITTNLAESFKAWIMKERRHNVA